MGYEGDADINRFVRLGMIAVAVVGAFGWFMHDVAARRMRPASLEPPPLAASPSVLSVIGR